MRKLTFVIGAPAAGKSYFIEQNFKDKNVDIPDIFDYQQLSNIQEENTMFELVPSE